MAATLGVPYRLAVCDEAGQRLSHRPSWARMNSVGGTVRGSSFVPSRLALRSHNVMILAGVTRSMSTVSRTAHAFQ